MLGYSLRGKIGFHRTLFAQNSMPFFEFLKYLVALEKLFTNLFTLLFLQRFQREGIFWKEIIFEIEE